MENLSKVRRDKMIQFLETLKEQHSDDESLIAINQIEKELVSKRYGLVWEEHEENVDVMMQDNIPVFTEVSEREITEAPGEGYNFLLEGDNLHSLHLLERTHADRVSIIIIDPPYNMGSNDFIYDDNYVDKTDTFKHSKWLSFMYKRLTIARRLLKDNGVVFINIDDHEFAPLKMLCDEIFGEQNMVACFPWQNRTSIQNDTDISNNHEYIVTYAKKRRQIDRRLKPSNANRWFNMNDFVVQPMETDKSKYSNPDNDPRGLWKADPFDAPNIRPNLTYEIVNPNTGISYLPPKGRHWRMEQKKYEQLLDDNRIVFGVTGKTKPQLKVFYDESKSKGEVRNSWLSADKYSTSTQGKKELLSILPNLDSKKIFETPKPSQLYIELIKMAINPNEEKTIILDFFSVIGTLGDAVLKYAQKEKRNVKFILCTNNQNGICEYITYNRISNIIKGYIDNKGRRIEGIPANLKYYRTDFVSKDEEYLADALLDHIVEMIQLEHGINIDDNQYLLIMSDEEADNLEKHWKEYSEIRALYISQDVLLTTKQKAMFETVDIYIVPDCYFNFELREAGEIW